MDLLGVQADLAKAQAALDEALGRIAALEAQSAKDINAIADKVIAAAIPEIQATRSALTDGVNTLTLTVNATAVEVQNIVRRLDGAALTLKLGPEMPV